MRLTKVVLAGRERPAYNSFVRILSLMIVVTCSLMAHGSDAGDILRQTSGLRPEVLELALEAYEQARSEGVVEREVLTIVDYELPSYKQRLWVIDMKVPRVLFQEWVAHGMGKPRGSGGDMEQALSFSNEKGTLKSSLGLFITAETYYGRHGYSL